jgi:DNA invertase Pin-like site-specific DNA recombinase
MSWEPRPGFAEMLAHRLSYGARTVLVERPDRFARDLRVQLAGHNMLEAKGVTSVRRQSQRSLSRTLRPPF